MKAGKEHRVPLTAPASEIIGELGKLKAHNYVFPSQKSNKPLSNMTMAAVLKRMHLNYRPHGFRSSFRTWVAEETDHQFEVAEAALVPFWLFSWLYALQFRVSHVHGYLLLRFVLIGEIQF